MFKRRSSESLLQSTTLANTLSLTILLLTVIHHLSMQQSIRKLEQK
ncbi:hypothetical protein GJU40_06780 [Bacillus lacus]|uniref:Uncharacterized protein n=1 Tax=Metabacillus lacus TaxID=1983721 RepID=A0A7X2IYL7_9BACI|nr:hypothetical protein [Metabacillus lacus]MRX71877.1 hypothetical protein [Metabacillus lacus]